MKSLAGALLLCCLVAPKLELPKIDTVPAIEAPVSSHKSGIYLSNGSLNIYLQSGTPHAEIFYSTDGENFTKYNDKIVITENTDVIAYSTLGTRTSTQIHYSYRLRPGVYIDTDNLAAISLSTPVGATTISYTVDDEPERTYTSPISVEDGATLQVRVEREGWLPTTKSIVIEDSKQEVLQTSVALSPVKTRYYYNLLSQKQKECYLALEAGVSSYQTKIDISSLGLTSDEFETAYWAFDYENPAYFWLGNSLSYDHLRDKVVYVYPQYSRSWNKARDIQTEFDRVSADVLAKASSNPTKFDQLLYLHDWIVDHTDYISDGSSYISEADGPIAYGRALCEGYAKAFAYLSNQLGYNCICVVGTTKEEHMWNMVEIDGEWYHVDVTSDDPISRIDASLHDYFCVTTSYIEKDHSIDNVLPIPEANASKYNYYEYLDIPTFSSVTLAYNDLLRQAADGNKHLSVNCATGVLPDLITKVKTSFYKDLKARGVYPKEYAYQRYTHSLIVELTY